MNSPLDATAVYRAGKGKKHGRFFMGAGYISTPTTLSEVRTTSTASTDEVHIERRPRPSQGIYSQFSELQAMLKEEIEARQRLEQMLMQALRTGTLLDSPTPGEPLPNLSTPGTAESVASAANASGNAEDGACVIAGANAEDAGANVEDHVNVSHRREATTRTHKMMLE